VLNSDLKLYGFDGTLWTAVNTSSFSQTYTNVTNNVYTITVPNGSPAYSVYGIFYASLAPNLTPTATVTAVPFKSTRSFNPNHSNPIYRKARFYYSNLTPKDVLVDIYDTSGALVKSMSLGNGVNITDVQTDPVYGNSSYFFTWDGTNDTGNLVKNGIYLVRYRVTKIDGSSDTQTKLVALIK
jgi:hypothetical protein